MTAELLLVGFATRDRARDQPAHSWRMGGLDIRPLCSADPWVRWAKVHGIEVLLRGTEEDDRRSCLFELGADDSPSLGVESHGHAGCGDDTARDR